MAAGDMRVEDRRAGPRAEARVAEPQTAVPVAPEVLAPPVAALSYSSLAEYKRCGYRFYVERVLRLPAVRGESGESGGAGAEPREGTVGATERGTLSATERGTLVHALLERLDFRRPLDATPEAIAAVSRTYGVPAPGEVDTAEIAGLVRAFARSELCTRLANATQVQREQRFTFALPDGTLLTGALDVLAREREGMLVVDYKSDRLTDTDPRTIVRRAYAVQQLIYAIAVLRSGAELVHVAHVFLERPDEPVLEAYSAGDAPELEARLLERTRGVRERRFTVTAEPLRAVCAGCPAEGGLCSWPVEVTRRERPDQLF
jgi:RecB family exonuclease